MSSEVSDVNSTCVLASLGGYQYCSFDGGCGYKSVSEWDCVRAARKIREMLFQNGSTSSSEAGNQYTWQIPDQNWVSNIAEVVQSGKINYRVVRAKQHCKEDDYSGTF